MGGAAHCGAGKLVNVASVLIL